MEPLVAQEVKPTFESIAKNREAAKREADRAFMKKFAH